MDFSRLVRFARPLPEELPAPRCWCCGSLLTTRGVCPVCEMGGPVSPTHVCARSRRLIEDEHGCAPEVAPPASFGPLGPDHETMLLRGLDAA